MSTGDQPLRLAGLISGGGRTLVNLLDHIERGELDASLGCVIASRRDIAGVQRLRERGLDVHIVDHREYDDPETCHDQITALLRAAKIDLVALCGWLRWMRIDDDFVGRVINIHPSLLPAFGGPGMYGDRVHRAVLESGVRETGCTVHWVDDIYDHGSIILQRRAPVLPDDTVETLAARVFEQECIAYPQAIGQVAPRLRTS